MLAYQKRSLHHLQQDLQARSPNPEPENHLSVRAIQSCVESAWCQAHTSPPQIVMIAHWVRAVTAIPTHTQQVAACADELQKHLKAAQAAQSGSPDPVSGFLLMCPSCIAAQLEAQSDILNAVFARLHEHGGALGVENMRVVSYTDDVERSYADWAAAFAGGDAKGAVDAPEASAAVNVASGINLKFIAFGQQLQ